MVARSLPVFVILGVIAGCLAPANDLLGRDNGTNGPNGPNGAQPAGPPGTVVDVESKPMLRLTNAQYRNVVHTVFDVEVEDGLPPEAVDDHYIAQASAQVASDIHAEAYSKVAASIASKISGDTTKRQALVGCEPKAAASDPCLGEFARRLTRKLYRRPSDPADLQALLGFATNGVTDGWEAVRSILEVALQSPRFLYRTNITVDAEERPGQKRLDGWSVASNLSFLLNDTAPDDTLLDLAEKDALADASSIGAQAQRLLDKPEAAAGLATFYRQWLAMDALLNRTKDTGTFPKFSPDLIASMEREISMTAADLAASKRPFLDLLDADFTYLDARLAAFYGVTAPAGDGFVRSPNPDGRIGLTSRGGFLANISSATSSSPTQRGNFILRRIVCQETGPAVMDIQAVDPTPDVPKTTRQRMEQIHAQGGCQGCHRSMDGIGFGLEEFDGLGNRRTTDNGLPIDDHGLLVVAGRDLPFQGAVELAQALKKTPETNGCLVTNIVRWAVGRKVTPKEAPGATALTAHIAEGDRSLKSQLLALVASDFFRLQPSQ